MVPAAGQRNEQALPAANPGSSVYFMLRINKNAIFKALAGALGYDVKKRNKHPKDIDAEAIDIYRQVEPYTMIGFERVFSLITAVRYVAGNGLKGAFVECGVWRGGASAAMALTLQSLNAEARDIHMFDTFEGMSRPTGEDVTFSNENALARFQDTQTGEESSDWCCAGIDEVKGNLTRLGLDVGGVHFVKGMVEDSIPEHAPDGDIALLRLDTDWYNSTKHELLHLFPKLVSGGVLIIDDYGDWQGARKAVDEYLADQGIAMLLTRIDGSVIGVKP